MREFSEFVSAFGTSVGRSENERDNVAAYGTLCAAMIPMISFFRSVLPLAVVDVFTPIGVALLRCPPVLP